MATRREPKKYGRYDRIEEAVHPGPALPKAPKRMAGKVEIVTAAVEDPNPVGGEKLKRQRVAVNVARDPLEREHAYGRISNQAYAAGIVYTEVLEISRGRRNGGVSFEPSDKGSAVNRHEWAIVARIERAEDAVELIHATRAAIGAWSELVLSGVLGDGLTFQQIAQQQKKGADWGRRIIARTFREGLEALALEWERKNCKR